jgi:hypothetical protein
VGKELLFHDFDNLRKNIGFSEPFSFYGLPAVCSCKKIKLKIGPPFLILLFLLFIHFLFLFLLILLFLYLLSCLFPPSSFVLPPPSSCFLLPPTYLVLPLSQLRN